MSNITALRSAFKGDLVTPADPDYTAAITRWALNAQRKAKIVAFVKDAEDVSLAIKYAKSADLDLAIRGGGHNPAGASSSDGGIVIDLSRYLAEATVDPERKVAFVGGGAVWKAVDEAAIKYGLATVGGTVNHTGVGGLLLGGGYGWLSGSYGLTIDNLVQATVVVGDGRILTANETENPDLFFGIRGGGCNFGVCTEFQLKLHPQRPTVFAGLAVFPASVLDKMIAITESWWLKGPGEKEGMAHVLTRGPNGDPVIVLILFYNGSEKEGRENFKAFFDLGPIMDGTAEIPYEQLNAIQNDSVDHGRCVYFKGVSQKKPDLPSIRKAFDRVIKLSERAGFNVFMVFEYFTLSKIDSVPNGQTAYVRYPGAANVLTNVNWERDTPENFQYGMEGARALSDIILAGQTGLTKAQSAGFQYGNYDPYLSAEVRRGSSVEDKAKNLFGDNYAKLQAIKKKYDGDMLFSKWFNITPAA